MKIKTKKQLNLPQLIEYIEQTDYEACVYQADDAPVYVRVGRIKGIHIEGSGTVFPHNTFTVEELVEITEDTKLEKVVEVYNDDAFGSRATAWKEKSIKDILATNQDDTRTKTIHLINDDGTLTLIWRDGRLIE